MPAQPDELLPKEIWLLSIMPPPLFPDTTSDVAFEPETVIGTRLDAAAVAFAPLEALGYKSIGPSRDSGTNIEILGYSSSWATIWIVFFHGTLLVVITPQPERVPDRLNHHLAAEEPGRRRVAIWGSFPVQPRNMPAAARAFLRDARALLEGGHPDFEALIPSLRDASVSVAKGARSRAAWIQAQQLAEHGLHKAAVQHLESSEDELSSEQIAFLERERAAASTEPPALQRGGMSEKDWVIARSDHVNAAQAQLHHASRERDSSTMARVAWWGAAAEVREAVDLLYRDFPELIRRSKEGDLAAMDYLITFLEADVWCFRSGYTKGRIYEALRQAHLDHRSRERLPPVLLRAVDAGYRREFRSACRLARTLADPGLRSALRERLRDPREPHRRRRALWMLAYMPQGIDEHDHFAREVLVDSANDRDWWRVSVWIARLCRRVTDDAFAQRVRDMALSYDESIARPGLRLLPWAMRRPLDAGERLALEGRVLDAARDSGPSAGLVEPLAAIADTERLRRRLTELAMTAETPVNRYARWGLNAAIRRNGEKAPDL